MPVAVCGSTIPAAPTARRRCHCCGAFPFPEGHDIPCPQGHGSIAVDPEFSLPLTPALALWALQGTPLPPSAHSGK